MFGNDTLKTSSVTDTRNIRNVRKRSKYRATVVQLHRGTLISVLFLQRNTIQP